MRASRPKQSLINAPPLLPDLVAQRAAISARADSWRPPQAWREWAGFVPDIQIRSGGRLQSMKPWDWQVQFTGLVLDDWGERSSYVFAKSRQCGASEGILSLLLWLALIAGSGLVPGIESGFCGLVTSKTQQDAWLLGRRLRRMVRSLGVQLETDALNLAVFSNGSTLMFRSGDPDSVGRGIESINAVFLDEFSFYDEQARTLEAIAPSMTSVPNSKLFVVSTPNGKGGEFWRLLCEPIGELALEQKLEGIRHETEPPFQIVKGSPRLILLNWREVYPGEKATFLDRIKTELNLTEATIQQEYEMQFLTDADDFIFPLPLVRACTGGGFEQDADTRAVYYAGVDVATSSQKNSDYTVCTIVRKTEEGKFTVAHLYRKRTGASQEHLNTIAGLIEQFEPIECTVETNGAGKVWLESLGGLNLPTKLEGFNTNRTSKESLVTRLLLALERGDILIPQSPITDELLAFKRDATGKLEAANGAHDDTVISLALALTSAGYTAEYRGL